MFRSLVLLAGLVAVAALPAAASGAAIPAGCTGITGDPASLRQAIVSANSLAGPDAVVLGDSCVYRLSQVQMDNPWYGPNGLPPIASDRCLPRRRPAIPDPGRSRSRSRAAAHPLPEARAAAVRATRPRQFAARARSRRSSAPPGATSCAARAGPT